MNEERVIDLEIKVAHQELAIEELQKTLFEQHLAIERFEKTLKQVTSRLEEFLGPEIGPGNQKPPHY